LLEKQPMLATALTPKIGYDEAAKLAKEALKSGRTVRELAHDRGLRDGELDDLLDLQKMTEPGLGGIGGG
jgi:fumarate hydratase class II